MTTSVKLSTFPRFKWIHRESPSASSDKKWESLATELGCSPFLARVLYARGIEDSQDAGIFLKPERKHILSPESIPGIERAVERILNAIADKEGILVHGDYDVDGIVGAVILHKTLKELGAGSGIFLPKRDFHGFGLSPSAVEIAKANGVKLIISVDCGISSHGAIQTAHDAGIEVIVTDHHAITTDPPKDVIIVHPELDGDYPGGKIAGATVSWKLALHLLKRAGKEFEKFETYYLPLIALATVADICPLVGENRTLTALGLELMPQSEIPALNPLIKGSQKPGENSPVNERSLAFGMAPVLNAAGRMGDPFPAAKLLLAKDVDSAWEHYRKLTGMNNERKKIQARTIERLSRRPEIAWSTEKSGVLAVVDEDCTPGLAGLAASRLAEMTSRPACVLAPAVDAKGPLYRGSIRTASGENLLDLLAPIDPFVEKSGGHKGAMGITVRPENLADFLDAVGHIEWIPSPNELILDFPVDSLPGDPKIVTELESTRPWGEGNPEPAFQLGPTSVREIRTVGKNLDHVQVSLKDGNGAFIKGIGFSLAKFLNSEDHSGKSVETAGHFILNHWQGRTSVEIRIADFEFKHE